MDTAIQLAEAIFSEGGLMALLVVLLLLILAGMVYTLFIVARKDDKNDATINALATSIAGFLEGLREISETSAEVGKNLESVARLLTDHDTKVATTLDDAVETLDKAVEAMRESVDTRTRQLGEIPQRVKYEMVEHLEGLPEAVEKALAPRWEQLLKDAEARLIEYIKNTTGSIPTDTSKLVCEAMETLKDSIAASINEMIADAIAKTSGDIKADGADVSPTANENKDKTVQESK